LSGLLLAVTAIVVAPFASTAGQGTSNEFYPLPQANYTCSANYYVNAAKGSDNNSNTQAQSSSTPWKTIRKATYGNTVFRPGACINVAAGTYSEDVILLNSRGTAGNANNATGYAVLRCATGPSAQTARPYLHLVTNGAEGSKPVCKINGSGDNPLGGIVATSTGTMVGNYAILDGFEVTSTITATVNVSGLSYNSSTGLVILTLASVPKPGGNGGLATAMGFSIAGLTGSGSINSANGYFFAGPGTAAKTVTYQLSHGLTMAYSGGGTLTYWSGDDVGIGPGSRAISLSANSHHVVLINNLVHDLGGAGIQTLYSDNIFVVGNIVYNTSWPNRYDESGIGIVENVSAHYTASTWDGVYGSVNGHTIRNVIANNISHHNGNLVGPQTDGNGIILDSISSHNQRSCNGEDYNYGWLLFGNIVYDNGGRGIHLFHANNAAVLNNSAYNNSVSTLNSTAYGIGASCSSSDQWQNNISWNVANGFGVKKYNMSALSGYPTERGFQYRNTWTNNIFNFTGPSICGSVGLAGIHGVCYNGFDYIGSSSHKPAEWSASTDYTQGQSVLYKGNIYASIGAGTNTGNIPSSNPALWQDDGLPNNVYPTDPLWVTDPPLIPSNFTLQLGSPAIGTGTAAVTALGGPAVSTPNIGALGASAFTAPTDSR